MRYQSAGDKKIGIVQSGGSLRATEIFCSFVSQLRSRTFMLQRKLWYFRDWQLVASKKKTLFFTYTVQSSVDVFN